MSERRAIFDSQTLTVERENDGASAARLYTVRLFRAEPAVVLDFAQLAHFATVLMREVNGDEYLLYRRVE